MSIKSRIPQKQELEELYLSRKLSTRQIGKIIGVEKTTILNWLKKYNIHIRSSKTFNWEIKGINPPSKGQLELDYKTLSLELIAKKYEVSVEAILGLFRKYNIKTRNWSEARRLAIQTKRSISWNKGLTKDNPMVLKMVNHLNKIHREKINESKIKQAGTRKRLHKEGKLKIWNRGIKYGEDYKKKLSEIQKNVFRSSEKMREIGMKAKPKYVNTKPEILMRKLLEKNNLTDGLVEQYHLIIGNFGTKPDFAYPKDKVAIYCDGEYWHGGFHYINQSFDKMKDGARKENIRRTMKKDAKQHFILWDNGWTPLRFWQHQIEKQSEWVIEQIKKNLFDKEYIKKREEQRKEAIKDNVK